MVRVAAFRVCDALSQHPPPWSSDQGGYPFAFVQRKSHSEEQGGGVPSHPPLPWNGEPGGLGHHPLFIDTEGENGTPYNR